MMSSRMKTTLASEGTLPDSMDTARPLDVSVVIPCLNEANSLAYCVDKAMGAFRKAGLVGEVIVADNGSTDGSIQIAEDRGARVLRVTERGYGAALRAGIIASRGPYIIMGDADDSYDFTDVPRFVEKLREGYAAVAQVFRQSGAYGFAESAFSCGHRGQLLRHARLFTGAVRQIGCAQLGDGVRA